MTPESSVRLGQRLANRLFPVVVLIGVVISLGFPATYAVLQFTALQHQAASHARHLAIELRDLVVEAPSLWKYQTYKYLTILRESPLLPDVTEIRILDDSGRSIPGYEIRAENAGAWPHRWSPVGSAAIELNDRQIGAVEVRVSQTHLIGETLGILLLSVVSGLGLTVLVYRFPVKVVESMEEQIETLIGDVERSNERLTALLVEARRHEQEALGLESVARDISSSSDRARTIERILEWTRELCSADIAALATYDRDGDLATIVAVAGARTNALTSRAIRGGQGAAGKVLASGEPLYTDAYAQAPEVSKEEVSFAATEGIGPVAILPLKLRGALIGLLWVARRHSRGFTSKDTVILNRLADQTVIALENARLQEERINVAREEGRLRIAYDLHDGVAQLIVSAKQHAETCQDVWAVDPGRGVQELEKSIGRLDQAIREIRRLLMALRPSAIEAFGLVKALRLTLDDTAREADWSVGFTENLGQRRVPLPIETAIFRIAQEALANVASHARASRVTLTLEFEGDRLGLEVRDNGVGFAMASSGGTERGFGLRSMQERARRLGGICTIESSPAQGTRVTVQVPLGGGHTNDQ